MALIYGEFAMQHAIILILTDVIPNPNSQYCITRTRTPSSPNSEGEILHIYDSLRRGRKMCD